MLLYVSQDLLGENNHTFAPGDAVTIIDPHIDGGQAHKYCVTRTQLIDGEAIFAAPFPPYIRW